MSEQLAVFVDVIIPVAIPRALTYRVSKELIDYMQVGVRVIVPLGKTKRYSAIVQRVHDSPHKTSGSARSRAPRVPPVHVL